MNEDESSEILQQYVLEHFECKHCGLCCKISDPIHLLSDDIDNLANYMDKPIKIIQKRYLKPHPDRPGEFAFKITKPCKFYNLKFKKCNIYEARPWICKIYPISSISVEMSDRGIFFNRDPDCPEIKGILQKLIDDINEYIQVKNSKEGYSDR